MYRPLFRQSLETQKLIKLLSDESHDDTFTYNELSDAAGTDVRRHRGCLETARKSLLRDKQIVFEAIPGVGLKRADDAMIVDARTSDMSRIRNVARRGLKKLACVRDFAQLNGDKQIRFNLLTSGLGMLYHITTPNAQAAIEQVVIQKKTKLPVEETLAALK